MKFTLVFVTIVATFVNFGLADLKTPPGKALFDSLPSEERVDFLIFSLGDGYTKSATKLEQIASPDLRFPDDLGINKELIKKFQNLRCPINFTSNLYIWIRVIYNLDQSETHELILRRWVCLANGNCIDINDIGGMCCPF